MHSLRAPGWGRLTGSRVSTLPLQLARLKKNFGVFGSVCLLQGGRGICQGPFVHNGVNGVAASLSGSPSPLLASSHSEFP